MDDGQQRARRLRCRARIEEERRRAAAGKLRLFSALLTALAVGAVLTTGLTPPALAITTIREPSTCQRPSRFRPGEIPAKNVNIRSSNVSRDCTARFIWPVRHPEVVKAFDEPEHNWNPGHRGVDLRTAPGEELLAPAKGIISFAGIVAGKSVVSIRHGLLTSTFEPAISSKGVGARLESGEVFASVQGESDHCEDRCVHWGLKRGKADYVDPAQYVIPRKIGLLP